MFEEIPLTTMLERAFPMELGVLFIIALFCVATGIFRYKSFFALGFPLAMALQSAYILMHTYILQPDSFSLYAIVPAILLIDGLRIVTENTLADGFGKKESEMRAEKRLPIPLSILMWLGLSLLVTGVMAPVLYRALSLSVKGSMSAYLSVAVVVFLYLMAWIFSACRSRANKMRRVPTRGFFAIVRYPEVLVRFFLFLSLPVSIFMFYRFNWIRAIICLVAYVAFLFYGLHQLADREAKDNERFAKDPNYAAYISYTPIVIPLIPFMTMQKKKK